MSAQKAARRIAEREEVARRIIRKQLSSAGRKTRTMTELKMAYDPSKASPADAHKLILQIAELLNVDDPSFDAVDAALKQLFALVSGKTQEDSETVDPKVVDASRRLTKAQLALCKERGISPIQFAQVQLALNRPLASRR